MSERSYSPSSPRSYGSRGDSPIVLLVRNLRLDCTPEELMRAFEQFGHVENVYLPRDYYTGDARGFGFVHYLDPADAAEARYQMDGQVMHGRVLAVFFADENLGQSVYAIEGSRGRSRSRYPSQSPPRNSQSPPPTRRYLTRGLSHSRYSSQSLPRDSLSPPPTRRYSSRGLSHSRYSSQSLPRDSLSPPPTRRYSSQHRNYNVSPPRSRAGSRSPHHPAVYPRAPPRSPSHYCSNFVGTMCRCNRDVAIGTTWTAKNPARKFACCTNLDKPNGCNFLQWAEPEICEKGLEIGRGFIRFLEQKNDKIQTLEANNESLKSNIVTRNQVALKATRENEDMKMKLQETEEKLKKLESEISSRCVIC